MSENKVTVSRPLVGVITICCFVAAFLVWYFAPDVENEFWLGGFIRVGILMGAFWLALPTQRRPAAWANISPWSLAAILLFVFLLPRLKQPLLLGLIAVVVVAGAILRPRGRTRLR